LRHVLARPVRLRVPQQPMGELESLSRMDSSSSLARSSARWALAVHAQAVHQCRRWMQTPLRKS
jgi:hypothetical protein